MKNDLYHFIGIGGIGMSAIALTMKKMGYNVQGSDQAQSLILDNLAQNGIKIFRSHDVNALLNVDKVVVSSAIKDNNIELNAAKAQNIEVISRGKMLATIMLGKKGIAISGTHGKTTTTSLMAHALETANLDPTVISGGIMNSSLSNARFGSGDLFISEADESDGSFNLLPKHIAVVTNIDHDHMDYHKTFNMLIDNFTKFISSVDKDGFAVLCGDDQNLLKIAENMDKKIILYGLSDFLDLRAVNIRTISNYTIFDCLYHDKIIHDIQLNLLGDHNVKNSMAVLAVLLELEVDIAQIKTAFATFQGVQRRFTKVGEFNGVTIIDDYAHHPVEMEAVIQAAKKIIKGKVITVMQPHRYSRFQSLFDKFCDIAQKSDHSFILPIYAAGESEIPNVSSDNLYQNLLSKGFLNIHQVKTIDELAQKLMQIIQPDDIILMLGAGDITNWARRLEACLKNIQNVCIKNIQ